jgi:two-component system chemotaxis response regulator CheB
VAALQTLVQDLPSDLPASIFVVLHISPDFPSVLAKILARAGPLPAKQPRDGERFQKGHIYVAPPDHHMLLHRGHLRVVRGPHENRHRPAVDPLFRSAAYYYGPRVIGVVLTGALNDGTSGMMAVKRRGGIAVVQDPNEAAYASMPLNVMEYVQVDYVQELRNIAPLLSELAASPVAEEEYPMPDELELEVQIVEGTSTDPNALDRLGTPSYFTCPECHGTLWEMHDGDLLRFRCRVGHAFTAETMLAQHDTAVEAALWAAARSLEESATLNRRLAERARGLPSGTVAERFDRKAAEAQSQSEVIRRLLMSKQPHRHPAHPQGTAPEIGGTALAGS